MRNRLLTALHSRTSHALSLLIGSVLALFILIAPQHIASDPTELEHGSLSLLMIAICLLFIHGVGFQLRSPLMQWLLSPLTLWPLTAALTVITLPVL